MATNQMTDYETPNMLRKRGVNALVKELGVVGMVDFLRQFDPGSGDYTKEKEALLADVTMEDVERYLAEREKEKGDSHEHSGEN